MATTQRRTAISKDGMRTLNAYLVYRASDQSLRVVSKQPRLAWDEVAFTVQVRVPDPWGRLAGAIVVELPENGPAVVEVQHNAP